MDRRHAFMKEYTFYVDDTMLSVEVLVSGVASQKACPELPS